MTRKPHTRRPNAPSPSDTTVDSGPTPVDYPVFGQPRPTADPTKFRIHHPSDNPIYKQIDELNRQHKLAPLPFPEPRGLPEPRLTLAAVLGNDGAAAEKQIAARGQIVFHSTGDTGNTLGRRLKAASPTRWSMTSRTTRRIRRVSFCILGT